jgi:hypothetical protein
LLDEELPTLLPLISGCQSASDALEVEGEVGTQDFMVRQLFHLSVLNLGLIKDART